MIARDSLLKLLKKEFVTTTKVLNAFPPDQKGFTPHERSNTALALISTFVFEMYLIKMHLLDASLDPSVFKTYKPDSIVDAIKDFEKETAEVLSGLNKLTESDLSKSVSFAGRTFQGVEFVLMMLFDQIHHRGQLSVYVRMAGGKVPSIYGPSADDPMPNL